MGKVEYLVFADKKKETRLMKAKKRRKVIANMLSAEIFSYWTEMGISFT